MDSAIAFDVEITREGEDEDKSKEDKEDKRGREIYDETLDEMACIEWTHEQYQNISHSVHSVNF